MSPLQTLLSVAILLQNAQQAYQALCQFCNQVYSGMFPGGATPTADQQAATIAAVAMCGTSAAQAFQWHYQACLMVQAYEAQNGITAAHAWVQANGLPGIPAGWTETAVVDGSGNPTGALTLAYTAPTGG